MKSISRLASAVSLLPKMAHSHANPQAQSWHSYLIFELHGGRSREPAPPASIMRLWDAEAFARAPMSIGWEMSQPSRSLVTHPSDADANARQRQDVGIQRLESCRPPAPPSPPPSPHLPSVTPRDRRWNSPHVLERSGIHPSHWVP